MPASSFLLVPGGRSAMRRRPGAVAARDMRGMILHVTTAFLVKSGLAQLAADGGVATLPSTTSSVSRTWGSLPAREATRLNRELARVSSEVR